MSTTKGIILAGGNGTRLYPVTQGLSKQLLPIYDKPMIYYPLSTLMLTGIRQILVINTPHEQPLFQKLLRDGSQWGIDITYVVQPSPDGLAQAFLIGRQFIGTDPSCLILGDNIFHGHHLTRYLHRAAARHYGATIFGYRVSNPERYGVAYFDAQDKVINLEEKPVQPTSSYAVTGLYFYDNRVCDYATSLKPSARGELEITDLNRCYMHDGSLNLEKLDRGLSWFDTGTHDSLLEAGHYIQTIERRQGLKVCCPEEIAYLNNWIDCEQLLRLAAPLTKNSYGQYLEKLPEQGASR